jgi:hypothetical protein
VTVSVAAPGGHGQDQKREDREAHQAELQEERLRLDLLSAPTDREREAEHEEEVREDTAGQRAAHDVREAVRDRDGGDDQLGRVAEAGIEKAADPRPRVLRRVLGRLADEPRERYE